MARIFFCVRNFFVKKWKKPESFSLLALVGVTIEKGQPLQYTPVGRSPVELYSAPARGRSVSDCFPLCENILTKNCNIEPRCAIFNINCIKEAFQIKKRGTWELVQSGDVPNRVASSALEKFVCNVKLI